MDALAKATHYLNVKPRTRRQVINYLLDKGYNSSEIESAVAALEEYKYIDDENFAHLYFELGFEKGHGIARIKRELTDKGIERNLIDEVYNELMCQEKVPDQYEMALEIGQQIATEVGRRVSLEDEALGYEQKIKTQAKIARRLATRGFSSDIAYRVARNIVK